MFLKRLESSHHWRQLGVGDEVALAVRQAVGDVHRFQAVARCRQQRCDAYDSQRVHKVQYGISCVCPAPVLVSYSDIPC